MLWVWLAALALLFLQKLWFVSSLMTLPPTINETQKLLWSLPVLMQSHYGSDSVALGIVLPSPTSWDLGPPHQ